MQSSWFTYRNLLTVIGVAFAIWFVWNFYIIISYFFIAGIISLLGRPVVDMMYKVKFGRFKTPDWLAAVVAMLVIIGILSGMLAVFVPMLQEQAEIIYSIDTKKVAASLEEPLMRLEYFIVQFQGGSSDTTLRGVITERLNEWISLTSLGHIVNSLLSSLGSIAVAIFSIVFITFFFLKDQRLLYEIVMIVTPTRFETQMKNILRSSKITLTRYFGGIIIQSSVVVLLVTTGLWVMGFQNALLIGFFCGIVNIIPYLGPLIGTGFALLITISTTLNVHPDTDLAPIIIKIVFLIQGVQFIDNYIAQPIIFSKRMNAHPLEIFFIVLIFGSLAGIPGMIAAVPTYSFLRLVAREFFSEFKIVRIMTENIDN
jgi:predicted PurR-regulated permease PerM